MEIRCVGSVQYTGTIRIGLVVLDGRVVHQDSYEVECDGVSNNYIAQCMAIEEAVKYRNSSDVVIYNSDSNACRRYPNVKPLSSSDMRSVTLLARNGLKKSDYTNDIVVEDRDCPW